MRFIGKKSVCGAALGLLLAFYFFRKRKTQGKVVADDSVNADLQPPQTPPVATPDPVAPPIAAPDPDAPPIAAPDPDAPAPSVSDSSAAETDDVGATAAADPDEPTPATPPNSVESQSHSGSEGVPAAALTASPSTPTLVDTPAPYVTPADDSGDAEPGDDASATNADLSVYEDAFDTPPNADEPLSDSDSESISDTPPNAAKQPKRRRTPQSSQPRQSQTQRRQSGGRPRLHRGRRVPTHMYYPPNSLPTEVAKLRCRKAADGWEIFVALPERRQAVEAFHGKDELDLDGVSDEIRLDRFDGAVFVRYEDDAVDRIQLADASEGKPLFFRMREDWAGDGRLVGKPAAGFVVAIAPQGYADEWDDVEADIEPEDCVDPDFQARFLFLKGTPLDAPTPMRLNGTKLPDLNAEDQHHGELYIGAPPKLSVDPQISVAVIVEETGVRADNEWVQDFQPHNQSIASVLDGREGRFSVRTYLDGSRRETRTFRYFPSLKHITLDGQLHTADANTATFPDKGNGAHQAIELRFVSNDGDSLRPTLAKATAADVDKPTKLQITDAGVVIIPPLPSIETVKCEFPNRASIALAIPRVRWRKTDEDGAVGDWSGAVFSIPRGEFVSLLKTRLEIKTPRWVNSLSIGFGDRTDNEIPAVQGRASVELISFAYAEELEGTLDEDLFLNIRINGQSAPIVRVLADPVPHDGDDFDMIEIRRISEDSLVCLARRSVDVNKGGIYKVKTHMGKGAVVDGIVDEIRPRSTRNNPRMVDVTI